MLISLGDKVIKGYLKNIKIPLSALATAMSVAVRGTRDSREVFQYSIEVIMMCVGKVEKV